MTEDVFSKISSILGFEVVNKVKDGINLLISLLHMERSHDRTYVNENFLIIFDEINMIESEKETIIITLCRLKDKINSVDAYVAESEVGKLYECSAVYSKKVLDIYCGEAQKHRVITMQVRV